MKIAIKIEDSIANECKDSPRKRLLEIQKIPMQSALHYSRTIDLLQKKLAKCPKSKDIRVSRLYHDAKILFWEK